MEEISAAESMLSNFYKLIPELYGDTYCSHNVHLLSHLCKYVKLWGPLWTHSVFGYESKNGQIKHLFHGNDDDIFHQILFNIDVNFTMQLMCHHLPVEENRNTQQIFDHCYIIGSTVKTTLTTEQRCAIQREQDTFHVFFRLYKNGIVYHSTGYVNNRTLKRENTICTFIGNDDLVKYGQINLFVGGTSPVALVTTFCTSDTSLMASAGNPFRPQLLTYKRVDLLSTFITPGISMVQIF